MENLDKETLRHLVLEYFKKEQSTQFNNVVVGVGLLVVENSYISTLTDDQKRNPVGFMHQYEIVIYEILWDLIIQGVITPGINSSNPNLPWIRVTSYGKMCLEKNEILPHDYNEFLKKIKTIDSINDAVFYLYLEESLQCFNRGLYLSSVVALGVASERLAGILINSYGTYLKSVSEREKFTQSINKARFIGPQFDEFYKRVISNKDLALNSQEDLEPVRNIVEIIRRERNDAGHPSGKKFDRNEAVLLLTVFPFHFEKVVKLYNALKPKK